MRTETVLYLNSPRVQWRLRTSGSYATLLLDPISYEAVVLGLMFGCSSSALARRAELWKAVYV